MRLRRSIRQFQTHVKLQGLVFENLIKQRFIKKIGIRNQRKLPAS